MSRLEINFNLKRGLNEFQVTETTSGSLVVQYTVHLRRTLADQETPSLGLIDIWYEILSVNRWGQHWGPVVTVTTLLSAALAQPPQYLHSHCNQHSRNNRAENSTPRIQFSEGIISSSQCNVLPADHLDLISKGYFS